MIETLRRLWHRALPQPVRQTLRRVRQEIPIRIGDLPADLRDRFSSGLPLPPPRLRSRVSTTSARSEYLYVGELVSRAILESFDTARSAGSTYPRWLDFGCGSGRIARHLLGHDEVVSMTGIDIDAPAVSWCQRNLPGRWIVIDADPPTALETGSFDLIYCISVFTHLDEEAQLEWLGEVARLLRPGGLFIASTHPPQLTYNRPDLTPSDHQRLQETGFLFAPGSGAFNDDSAFHSLDYLNRVWARELELCFHRPGALAEVQDLSAWRKTT